MPRHNRASKRKFRTKPSYSKKRKLTKNLAQKINKLASVDSLLLHQSHYLLRSATKLSSTTSKSSLLDKNLNKKANKISSKKAVSKKKNLCITLIHTFDWIFQTVQASQIAKR